VLAAHSLTVAVAALRALFIGLGTAAVVIGAAQIFRTLQMVVAGNADDVIRRAGLLIGIGAALLTAAFF